MGKKRDKETKKRDDMYAKSMGFVAAGHMAGGNFDERKALMKRYNIDEADYASQGAISQGRVHGKKSYSDMYDELMYRANNDYDSRRAMEAAAMSGDKDAKSFAKKGIKNASGLIERDALMRKYHKDMGSGGSFSSNSDYAGVSYHKVKEDRDAQTEDYKGMFAGLDDFNAFKEDMKKKATGEEAAAPVVEKSDRLKGVEDRLENAAAGNTNRPPSLFDEENTPPAANDDQKQAASNFLEDYKLDVVKGANLKHDIEEGLSNASRAVRDAYGR